MYCVRYFLSFFSQNCDKFIYQTMLKNEWPPAINNTKFSIRDLELITITIEPSSRKLILSAKRIKAYRYATTLQSWKIKLWNRLISFEIFFLFFLFFFGFYIALRLIFKILYVIIMMADKYGLKFHSRIFLFFFFLQTIRTRFPIFKNFNQFFGRDETI